MALLKYPNPNEILSSLHTLELTAWKQMQTGAIYLSCTTFHKALTLIRKVHYSSSWDPLVATAGMPWVQRIAKICFNLSLVIVRSPLHRNTHPLPSLLVENALLAGVNATERGFWVRGFKYVGDEEEEEERGWLYYHIAYFYRTRCVIGVLEQVEDFLRRALVLLPGNALVLEEWWRFLAWRHYLRWGVWVD
ncbi:hypothetical protein T440DRAFT_468729 [Plenodomus tracheiphilus IPT5]|uniref:Uncharacterized protein n=1 Tax=Plenodomus tracheiphilus IPT5 TaxID=1408161 RepID=A0A6A7B3F7_9PLEO|nr:hypothetical protein T440DRAFT_468729 [Plenodomus tracheiphilus IPT5]